MAGFFDDYIRNNNIQGLNGQYAPTTGYPTPGGSYVNQAGNRNSLAPGAAAAAGSRNPDEQPNTSHFTTDQASPPQAQQAAAASSGGGGGGGGGGGSGGGGANNNLLKNNTLYNPSNAAAALRNAMIANGMHPFSGNPFVRAMLSFAPGLATAFLGSMTGGDATAHAGETGTGDAFKAFLDKALRGGVGTMASTLSGFGQGGLQGINSAVNSYRNAIEQGKGEETLNPYAAMLDAILTQSGGPANMIASVRSPFLTPQISQAYGSGLSAAGDVALNFLSPDPSSQDSVFNWLLTH